MAFHWRQSIISSERDTTSPSFPLYYGLTRFGEVSHRSYQIKPRLRERDEDPRKKVAKGGSFRLLQGTHTHQECLKQYLTLSAVED